MKTLMRKESVTFNFSFMESKGKIIVMEEKILKFTQISTRARRMPKFVGNKAKGRI